MLQHLADVAAARTRAVRNAARPGRAKAKLVLRLRSHERSHREPFGHEEAAFRLAAESIALAFAAGCRRGGLSRRPPFAEQRVGRIPQPVAECQTWRELLAASSEQNLEEGQMTERNLHDFAQGWSAATQTAEMEYFE